MYYQKEILKNNLRMFARFRILFIKMKYSFDYVFHFLVTKTQMQNAQIGLMMQKSHLPETDITFNPNKKKKGKGEE